MGDSSHLSLERGDRTADAEVGSGWSMEIGSASETVFDLTGSVQPGENVVMIELMGTGNLISFDVYEGRSW